MKTFRAFVRVAHEHFSEEIMADYDQLRSGAETAGGIQPRPLNIAILTHNALASTKLCLDSIAQHTATPHNIFLLDNLSNDETPHWLSGQTQPNLFYRLSQVNTGVPGGRNVLIRMIDPHLPADGFVVFLDNDMEVLPGWDAIAMDFFAAWPEAGIASAYGHRMIVYRNGRELLPAPKITEEVDVACGGFACFMRASAVRAVGDFDENLGLFWHEDDDYSVRAIQKGFGVYALPHLPVIHHEHQSGFDTAEKRSKEDGSHTNQEYLVNKWRSMGAVDWHGRIIRTRRQVIAQPQREVMPGVTFEGIDRDGGGRFLMLQNACIRVAGQGLTTPVKFEFDLRCDPRSYYDRFPFDLEIYLNKSHHSSLSFSSSNQIARASIDLEPGRDAEIHLRSQAAYVPMLGNQSQTDQRAVFGYIGNLSLAQCEASPAPSAAPDSRRSLPEDPLESGLLIIGPALESGESGALCRSIVKSLPDNLAVQVHVTRLEEKQLRELRQDPAEVAVWHKSLSRNLSGGSAIIILPSFPGPDPDFFLKYKQQFPHISRWIALLNPEADELPAWYLQACSSLDRIWLLQNSARKALLAGGIPEARLHLLPVGADLNVFQPQVVSATPECQLAGFQFLSILDWRPEQAWDLLLQAYLRSFKPDEDVCLLLKSTSLHKTVAQRLVNSYIEALGLQPGQTARIQVVDDAIGEARLPSLLRTVDCLVQANRDRGCGFYQMQGMAMGLPVITASWDASEGFATEQNSWLLSSGTPTEARSETSSIFPETARHCFWHEPELEEFSSRLRQAFDNREESARKGRLAREQVLRDHSRHRIIAWLLQECCLTNRHTPQATTEPLVKSAGLPPLQKQITVKATVPTIGIDARTLTYPETAQRGIGHYTYNHLSTLMRLNPEWRFVYYLHELTDDEALGKLLRAPNASWRRLEDHNFADLSLFHMPDLMSIMPGYDSPFNLLPASVPSSIILYDFIPIAMRECHFDQWHHSRRLAYQARLTQLRQSQAMILAISEHTRQDLGKYADIDPARARTIMAGLHTAMQQEAPQPAAVQQVLSRLGITGPFFLTVGGLDLHKGFAVTAAAYVNICKMTSMNLVVAGSGNDPYKEAYRAEFDRVGARGIVFTGYLEREDLQCLYAAATALVFPSRYEGFGLPVLEAMAHGCPVITLRASSLPEVAGDAAIMLEPDDMNGVAEAMLRLLQDSSLRASLRERGLRQAARFTWEDVAARTTAAWEELLGYSLTAAPSSTGKTGHTLGDLALLL